MLNNYYQTMERQFKQAGVNVKITKVPESRRASPKSLLKLDQDIETSKSMIFPPRYINPILLLE